ncbi:MAG: hypothetical protein WCL11_24125 [Verrucomicrobiota bacterium]
MQASQRFLALTLLLLSTAFAAADWEFFEKTNIKGTVSGIVQKGSTFETISGSIYQVTDITIQVVVEVMPEVTVLRDRTTFKLIVKGFEEPLVCKQLLPPAASAKATKEPAPPTTRSPAQDTPLEKLIPEDQQKEMGLQKLTPQEREKLRLHILNLCSSADNPGAKQDSSPAVSPPALTSPSVIESQLEGESEGFAEDTIFQLVNGQIWRQTQYRYRYHYAYRPKVLILNDGSGYKIKLDGIDETVSVKRLK